MDEADIEWFNYEMEMVRERAVERGLSPGELAQLLMKHAQGFGEDINERREEAGLEPIDYTL